MRTPVKILHLLNVFSKICEKAVKRQLMCYFGISVLLYQRKEKVTSLNRFLFVCYRNGVRLDKNFIVGAVLMDFKVSSRLYYC